MFCEFLLYSYNSTMPCILNKWQFSLKEVLYVCQFHSNHVVCVFFFWDLTEHNTHTENVACSHSWFLTRYAIKVRTGCSQVWSGPGRHVLNFRTFVGQVNSIKTLAFEMPSTFRTNQRVFYQIVSLRVVSFLKDDPKQLIKTESSLISKTRLKR